MIDTQKHIDYWRKSAESDIETARILIDKDKIKEGLFFCHLTLEKIFKAHFVNKTGNIAPKTHDLFYLLNKSDLTLTDEFQKLLTYISRYQLEGRYPDYNVPIPNKEYANDIFSKTKELLQWSTNLL